MTLMQWWTADARRANGVVPERFKDWSGSARRRALPLWGILFVGSVLKGLSSYVLFVWHFGLSLWPVASALRFGLTHRFDASAGVSA